MPPSQSFIVSKKLAIIGTVIWPATLNAAEAFVSTSSFLTPSLSTSEVVHHHPQDVYRQTSFPLSLFQTKEVSPRTLSKLHSSTESSTRFASSTSPSLTANDFSDIPPLEEELKATLIPSPFGPDEYLPTVHELISSLHENSGNNDIDDERRYREEVAKEVYIRLGRMYGFPHFNYASPPLDVLMQTRCDNDATKFSLENEFEEMDWLPSFDKIKLLHLDPLVLQIDDFFTSDECDSYIRRSLQDTNTAMEGQEDEEGFSTPPPLAIGQSRTVGQDEYILAKRTSHTWFHHYCGVPELMTKACRLLGLDYEFNYFREDFPNEEDEKEEVTLLECWEEPQTVRYQPNQKFTWHYDVLDPKSIDTLRDDGGQRIATLLVYLNEMDEENGGATLFRDLGPEEMIPLRVQPRKGSALLFFPSLGGIPNTPVDVRLAHCGEAVSSNSEQDKWISQLWLCETRYTALVPEGNSKVEGVKAMRRWMTKK